MFITIAVFLFGCLCFFLGFLLGELGLEPKINVPKEFDVHKGDDGIYYVYPIPKKEEIH